MRKNMRNFISEREENFMKKSFICITTLCIVGMLNAQYRKAPGFALFNRSDKLTTLSQLVKNKNVILSFWASYCVPCKREMPQLKEIENKYGKANNFEVVFVNIDKEGKNIAVPILNKLNIDNDCLFDLYQITAKKYIPDLKVPAVFIINRNGDVIFEAVGEKPDTLVKIENFVKNLR